MTSSAGWEGGTVKNNSGSLLRPVLKPPLITLATDFGNASPYVAVMKGVILTRCPQAHLVDLSHEIPPQDITHAAYFLHEAFPWYPPGTIHVVVVDPGVGTQRLPICVQLNGQFILCPDNGVWTLIETTTVPIVHVLSNSTHQLDVVSQTFHGRDIFAPAAAALANGIAPEEFGRQLVEWQRLNMSTVRYEQGMIHGEVMFIDHFGNLITNIKAEAMPGNATNIQIAGRTIPRLITTYGNASPGELIALISSSGYLEIAEVNGNAAKRLNVQRGEQLTARA